MNEDLVGKKIKNRYKVDKFLGRGGMAEVYKVFDTHRSVYLAMKVLYPDLAEDPAFVRRFKREAKNLAKLQHPNIVRFYDMEEDDLLVFLTMDYIEGTTLRSEIMRANGEPLSDERIFEIMTAVCGALNYAHREGVVHCDVKPANIMIEKTGRILLADFGIARQAEGATTTTMVGAGTPAYMAPEQVRGEDPTPQTDIYALGVVLYEMLTGGERPFTGEMAKVTGTTGEKVRWEQVNLTPISPRKFNNNISNNLEAIIFQCLSKEPENRFKNTIILLEKIDNCYVEIPDKKTKYFEIDSKSSSYTKENINSSKKYIVSVSVSLLVFFLIIIPTYLMGIQGKGPLKSLATVTPTSTFTSTYTITSSPTLTYTLIPTITIKPSKTPKPVPSKTPKPAPTSKWITIKFYNEGCGSQTIYLDGEVATIVPAYGTNKIQTFRGRHKIMICYAGYGTCAPSFYDDLYRDDTYTISKHPSCK